MRKNCHCRLNETGIQILEDVTPVRQLAFNFITGI